MDRLSLAGCRALPLAPRADERAVDVGQQKDDDDHHAHEAQPEHVRRDALVLLLDLGEVDLLALPSPTLLRPRVVVDEPAPLGAIPRRSAAACRSSFPDSSRTNWISAKIITSTPRIVRMIVPVSPSTPNVQNVVISSLHSSYGNASNMAHPFPQASTLVAGLPFVTAR